MVFTKKGNFSWGKGAAKAEEGKAKHQLRTHLGKKSTQKRWEPFTHIRRCLAKRWTSEH